MRSGAHSTINILQTGHKFLNRNIVNGRQDMDK